MDVMGDFVGDFVYGVGGNEDVVGVCFFKIGGGFC